MFNIHTVSIFYYKKIFSQIKQKENHQKKIETEWKSQVSEFVYVLAFGNANKLLINHHQQNSFHYSLI